MSRKRKRYSPEFKAKVALAAIRNEETNAEIAAKYQINPTMISNWKRALVEGASDLFDKDQKSKQNHEATVDKLYRKIGKLEVENDFLSKGLDF